MAFAILALALALALAATAALAFFAIPPQPRRIPVKVRDRRPPHR